MADEKNDDEIQDLRAKRHKVNDLMIHHNNKRWELLRWLFVHNIRKFNNELHRTIMLLNGLDLPVMGLAAQVMGAELSLRTDVCLKGDIDEWLDDHYAELVKADKSLDTLKKNLGMDDDWGTADGWSEDGWGF